MADSLTITTPKGAKVTVTLSADGLKVSVNGTDRGIATVNRFNPTYAEIVILGVGKAPVNNAADVDILKALVARAAKPVVKHHPYEQLAGETTSEWLGRQMYDRNGKLYG